MGGATLTTGPVPAHLGTGSGTAALNGNIVVNDSILFDTGTTTGSATATAGGLAGRLDLGASNRTIGVNGSSTLTVSAIVNGSGGIVKQGTGALNLTNANSFTGSIDLQDGVVSGTVQGVGNSIGSTGANVSMGGAVRLNGIGAAGTGTVNTLTSKDSGAHSGFIVDATGGGTTTLNVNSYGGREANTHGTI
jgi:autotransporter-associated beta strand protein